MLAYSKKKGIVDLWKHISAAKRTSIEKLFVKAKIIYIKKLDKKYNF